MAIPEWMKPQWEAIKVSDGILKRLRGRKGATVRSTKPIEMGGDGSVVDQSEVRGRGVWVEIGDGVKTEITGRARIVLAADGDVMVIAGGHGQSVTVLDAGRIDGKLKRETGGAIARDRRNKKTKLHRP